MELVTTGMIKKDLRSEENATKASRKDETTKSRWSSFGKNITFGTRWLLRAPSILVLLFFGLLGNGALIGIVMGTNLHLQSIGITGWQIGLLDGIISVAILFGSLGSKKIIVRIKPNLMMLGALGFLFIGIAALLVIENFWGILLALGFAFLSIPAIAIIGQPYMMAIIPEEIRGRVLTSAAILSITGSFLTQMLVGFLLKQAGWHGLIYGILACVVLAILLAAISATIRNLPDPSQMSEVEPLPVEL